MKTFVLGDCHGNHKGLLQCFERSGFNSKKDKLIVLGDTCDGWPFVKECFEELLKVKNLVYILGNHDEWALAWYDLESMYKDNPYVQPEHIWTSQGGEATLKSYGRNVHDAEKWAPMPESHLNILTNALYYYIDGANLFVHGGIIENRLLAETPKNVFLWDRDMWERAYGISHYNNKYKIQDWDSIFIGHTTVQYLTKDTKPVFACNVINLDTGSGWSGRLTIMDVKTKEYWQSDLTTELYPDIQGRR